MPSYEFQCDSCGLTQDFKDTLHQGDQCGADLLHGQGAVCQGLLRRVWSANFRKSDFNKDH